MRKRIWQSLIASLPVLLLVACQAVFTYSPLGFLQRDPSTLPLPQKMTFAEDALASGDADAILSAFEAISADAAASNDPDLNYLAAKLALELSGIPSMLTDIIEGDVLLSGSLDSVAVNDFISALDSDYIDDVGTFFEAANDNGAELTATDFLLGGASLLFAAADGGDIGNVTGAEADAIKDGFLQDGIDSLPDGDPAKDLLDAFSQFLNDEF